MTALPLLAKELTEIAARRRTYITRVVYALLLYGTFGAFLAPKLEFAGTPSMAAMGLGSSLFLSLIFFQLLGIYLFLPAMTCGLITQEKERDSLVLLFLTELKPWQILLQKYASGLISIFSFLLIGMPLAAFCYAYGGVPPKMLLTGVSTLFLACLQAAAFALLCSARARTTVGAFIGTYVFGAVFVFAIVFIVWCLNLLPGPLPFDAWKILQIFPNVIFTTSTYSGGSVLLGSLMPLGTTVVFLLLARFYLVRRAFAPSRNRLLGLFRRLDAFMQSANRWIGGIAFQTRNRALPEDDPIAWRELTRTALGRPQYLARVLIALEIVTVALALWSLSGSYRGEAMPFLGAVIGTLAVLALSALSANAFVSERVNQTFEVLLTTPLRATDIVRQKARMLARFAWVLAVPLMTLFSVECWMRPDLGGWWTWGAASPSLYLLCSVLTLAVYLPLVLWLSLWIGLKMRTRIRAIVTALAVIVGWCLVPIIIGVMFDTKPHDRWNAPLAFSCPLAIPISNESGQLTDVHAGPPWLVVSINFLIYGAILLAIRHRCLSRADAYLRG